MDFMGRWVGGDFVYVSEEKVLRDLSSNLARPEDIVVTQRGTLGQVSILAKSPGVDRYVVLQSQMAVSVDHKVANRDFVYYYLRSPEFLESPACEKRSIGYISSC